VGDISTFVPSSAWPHRHSNGYSNPPPPSLSVSLFSFDCWVRASTAAADNSSSVHFGVWGSRGRCVFQSLAIRMSSDFDPLRCGGQRLYLWAVAFPPTLAKLMDTRPTFHNSSIELRTRLCVFFLSIRTYVDIGHRLVICRVTAATTPSLTKHGGSVQPSPDRPRPVAGPQAVG
jgi:hypothetical protein